MEPKVVNLNKQRKARAKTEDKARSAENAVKFGRTKAQKTLEQARAAKKARDLDGKKRDR